MQTAGNPRHCGRDKRPGRGRYGTLMDFETDNPVAVSSPPRTIPLEAPMNGAVSSLHEPTAFLVDDDPEVRRSLRAVMESAGLRAMTFSTAREFLSAGAATKTGCLVLDIRLPGASGLELQERLVAMRSLLPVIVISGYADVALAVRAMRLGALDVLEKPFDTSLLIERIHEAIEFNRRAHQLREETDRIKGRISRLTTREQEVMRLVVEGNANKRIAAMLGISMKTVEAHRSHVMRKMGADSLAELVRKVQMVYAEHLMMPGTPRHSIN